MQLFNSFCFQIVRWFANSKEYESAELSCLLDTLMASICSKNNGSLREFSAVLIGEFIKWTIKQKSKEELKRNYGNFKSVIRRIESFGSHPDAFHRYGALLALKQLILYIKLLFVFVFLLLSSFIDT